MLTVLPMRFPSPFIVGAFLSMMASIPALGAPVNFKEVSLLVRMNESPAEIGNQIIRRKLSSPLTAEEIEALRRQGASEPLLQIAQDPRNHLAPEAAAQLQQAKAVALAAAQEKRLLQAQEEAAKESAPVPNPDDRNTELKYATEQLPWGKPLNLSKYGGSDTDIFVKSRSGTFYTVEIRNNERRMAAAPSAPATAQGGNPQVPEMVGRLESRTRIRVEKRNSVRISTERGDLYLAFVDKASGFHIYILDDNHSAPISTDLLIVSPKKF